MGWLKRRRGRKLTTPDGLPAVQFPTGYTRLLTLYGLTGSHGALYRAQPNVRSVVDFLAAEVAGVKIKLYEKVPSSLSLPSGRIELSDHDLQSVLDRPSPSMTRARLWRGTVSDHLVYDIAFWLKVRVRGKVRALVRVPPSALTPERDPITQLITGYKTVAGTIIPLSDLVIFPGYDPETVDGQVSPLETLRRILAEEQAAGRDREFRWLNSARKDGVVSRPLDAPPWSEEQREAWRVDFESAMTGDANAGRVALLEDGMTWHEATWSPKEMEYLAGRMLTRKECAAAFRVDPRLVFASDTPADKDARTAFYADRLVPYMTDFEEEIDRQLLPDFEPLARPGSIYTEFNIDTKLRGSFIEEAQVTSTATGRAWMTANEARARRNLPPMEDDPTADQLITPMNVTVGGQASPQSPVETPGPTPAPGETPRASAPGVLENLKTLQEPFIEAREELLLKFYRRQRRAVKSAQGVLDNARWDRELADDLAKEGSRTAAFFGRLAAKELGIDWKQDAAHWQEHASRTAGRMNRLTAADLPLEEVDGVFDRLEADVKSMAETMVRYEVRWAVTHAAEPGLD